MSRFLLIIAIAISLAGCGPGFATQVGELRSTPLTPSEGEWTIHFTHAGGIMGLNRTMEIDNNGQVIVTDTRTGKTANLQLSAGQLSELRRLADMVVYVPASKPSVCADCFVYSIEIDTASGKSFSAQVDDTTLESSGLSDLVEFLRNIMESAIKS